MRIPVAPGVWTLASLLLPGAAATAAPCTADLEAYRWTHRPLLVFAPDAADPRHLRFTERARVLEPELVDRDVPLIHSFVTSSRSDAACTLDPDAAARLRALFGVDPQDATVVLIGKDGGEKRRQSMDAPLEGLLELIDGMPMRQRETGTR